MSWKVISVSSLFENQKSYNNIHATLVFHTILMSITGVVQGKKDYKEFVFWNFSDTVNF